MEASTLLSFLTSDGGVTSSIPPSPSSSAPHPGHHRHVPSQPPTPLSPQSHGPDQTAVSLWEELGEVQRVERVLTPVFVILIAVSNITLLAHEAHVVWRTRRMIPPKLLVLALSAADLLATLVGYVPLWILFEVVRQDLVPVAGDNDTGSRAFLPRPTTESPSSGIHGLLQSLNPTASSSSTLPSSVASPAVTTGAVATTNDISTAVGADATSSTLGTLSSSLAASPPPPPPPSQGLQIFQPVVYTTGYAVAVFLLTAFWTLAQCIVVVMGVERFLALRAPYFYSARCTCGLFLVVLGMLGLLSCGVGGFHLAVHLEELHGGPPVFAGFLDSLSLAYNVFTLVQGLVWTVVLLTCNWAVRRELRRMEERVTVMRMKDHGEYMKQLSMIHGAGREFARLMMAVNVIFLLFSYPNLVCVLLRLCSLPPSFSIQYFCWRISHASALLNPFLYGFLRKSLRSRIRRFLNKHVTCLRPKQVSEVDAGPVVRHEQEEEGARAEHSNHRSPNSAIMPQDPEASIMNFSISE